MAMLIEYDKNPNISVDRKLQTLAESVQRAVDGIEMQGNAVKTISGRDGKDGKDAVLLLIESSTGNLFKNTAINATLYVTIISGDKTIQTKEELLSEFGQDARLCWGYKAMGETEFTDIPEDDERIGSDGFTLTLDSGDVIVKSTFVCNLIY